MNHLAALFKLDLKQFNLKRGIAVVVVLFLPLIVLSLINQQKYWLSLAFAALFVALSDPGGDYVTRLKRMLGVALIGALLTGLGFAIGGGPWGWVVLAAFVVTLLGGLTLRFGLHRFVGGALLNAWFLIVLAVPAGLHQTSSSSDWWGQALAWLIGSALWIGFTTVVWLARGRTVQAPALPEIPEGMESVELTRPIVLFTVLRAFAVGAAVAIAFGLHLPNAAWMPLAAFAAMKTSLDQTTQASEQRVVGTVIGAAVAMVFLLGVDNKHALELAIIVLGGFAASFRSVNYALYCAGIAGAMLIALDLPHPTNLSAEFERVLFTLAGVGIAIVVMLLASLLSKRNAASTS